MEKVHRISTLGVLSNWLQVGTVNGDGGDGCGGVSQCECTLTVLHIYVFFLVHLHIDLCIEGGSVNFAKKTGYVDGEYILMWNPLELSDL